MWIKKAHIENIRCIEALDWEVPDGRPLPGWHVLLGDNGSGKSAFLGSVAVALVGVAGTVGLRLNGRAWLRQGTRAASIEVNVVQSRAACSQSFVRPVRLTAEELGVAWQSTFVGDVGAIQEVDDHDAKPRFFSAGFGPFRRFTGGGRESSTPLESFPAVARHGSLFGEDVAFTECLKWLQDLKFKKLENNGKGALFDRVVRFVNESGLLQDARIHEVSSDQVTFIDANGAVVSVQELSDGFRSVLSLTFELIRQLAAHYGNDKVFDPDDPARVVAPGIVLIDEPDAHLHPTWQRRIGLWFKEHFPQIQFIVATHSPLICQAADTVFRLPTPGTGETGRMITGVELSRIVYGNVLDAYSTEAFGVGVTRSDASRRMLERLAQLNQKERHAGLTEVEAAEQQQLRATMPTAANASPGPALERVA